MSRLMNFVHVPVQKIQILCVNRLKYVMMAHAFCERLIYLEQALVT